jgi:hypothetical protein
VIAPPSNAQVPFLKRTLKNENEIWAGSVMAAGQFLSGDQDRVNSYSKHQIRYLRYRRHQKKLAPMINPG